MRELSPTKDWTWEKETQAHILYSIDAILAAIINQNRKRGQKRVEPPELMQPEYVKKAKADWTEQKAEKARPSQEEIDKIEAFWRKRNPNAKFKE